MAINRKIGSQDVSWFLDQHRLKRLELSPPYQRRSVWTSGDRRFLLDTIFKGYPCPPVYLHKQIDKKGEAIYAVIDGKQRLETVIRFAEENRLRLPADFGDTRLNNKRWGDIKDDVELRNRFLNYTFITEYFDEVGTSLVNEIFERMNRNSRKLTRQELRHARFDGWFSAQVDNELGDGMWQTFNVVTAGKTKRMADAQFISELLMVIIDEKIIGFNQDKIDDVYALYDDLADNEDALDEDKYSARLSRTKQRLLRLDEHGGRVQKYADTASNMYTLWSVLALEKAKISSFEGIAARYGRFMLKVRKLGELYKSNQPSEIAGDITPTGAAKGVFDYYQSNQSATTELPQRQVRYDALRAALFT